jgi:hypothetical protein
MAPDEPSFGPLQLIVVAFETTERFDGQIARELRDLRGATAEAEELLAKLEDEPPPAA